MSKNILIESIVKNISRKIINEAVSDKVVKQIQAPAEVERTKSIVETQEQVVTKQ